MKRERGNDDSRKGKLYFIGFIVFAVCSTILVLYEETFAEYYSYHDDKYSYFDLYGADHGFHKLAGIKRTRKSLPAELLVGIVSPINNSICRTSMLEWTIKGDSLLANYHGNSNTVNRTLQVDVYLDDEVISMSNSESRFNNDSLTSHELQMSMDAAFYGMHPGDAHEITIHVVLVHSPVGADSKLLASVQYSTWSHSMCYYFPHSSAEKNVKFNNKDIPDEVVATGPVDEMEGEGKDIGVNGNTAATESTGDSGGSVVVEEDLMSVESATNLQIALAVPEQHIYSTPTHRVSFNLASEQTSFASPLVSSAPKSASIYYVNIPYSHLLTLDELSNGSAPLHVIGSTSDNAHRKSLKVHHPVLTSETMDEGDVKEALAAVKAEGDGSSPRRRSRTIMQSTRRSDVLDDDEIDAILRERNPTNRGFNNALGFQTTTVPGLLPSMADELSLLMQKASGKSKSSDVVAPATEAVTATEAPPVSTNSSPTRMSSIYFDKGVTIVYPAQDMPQWNAPDLTLVLGFSHKRYITLGNDVDYVLTFDDEEFEINGFIREQMSAVINSELAASSQRQTASNTVSLADMSSYQMYVNRHSYVSLYPSVYASCDATDEPLYSTAIAPDVALIKIPISGITSKEWHYLMISTRQKRPPFSDSVEESLFVPLVYEWDARRLYHI